MKKNSLIILISILSIKGVFALDTFNTMFNTLPNAIFTRSITTTIDLNLATSNLDKSFDFITPSENKHTNSDANTNLFFVETTTLNYYEIIGINIISNTLNLQTNNQSFTNKKQNIFNSLGSFGKIIPLNNTEMYSINVSYISNGLYSMKTLNLNVESLKLVKVN